MANFAWKTAEITRQTLPASPTARHRPAAFIPVTIRTVTTLTVVTRASRSMTFSL
jgi:hypothetical protein